MSDESELLVIKELEAKVLSFFADAVRVLGLPKSVGEIYGSLYISKDPLSLDEIVAKLGISKGSGSQGLKMLRTLGAAKESGAREGRKMYYEAETELKSLVGGFIKSEIRPYLEGAKIDVVEMESLRKESISEDAFYKSRVEKLGKWNKRASMVLPILQKLLGK